MKLDAYRSVKTAKFRKALARG